MSKILHFGQCWGFCEASNKTKSEQDSNYPQNGSIFDLDQKRRKHQKKNEWLLWMPSYPSCTGESFWDRETYCLFVGLCLEILETEPKACIAGCTTTQVGTNASCMVRPAGRISVSEKMSGCKKKQFAHVVNPQTSAKGLCIIIIIMLCIYLIVQLDDPLSDYSIQHQLVRVSWPGCPKGEGAWRDIPFKDPREFLVAGTVSKNTLMYVVDRCWYRISKL